jgi:phosphate transport system permease protein
MMRSVAFRKTKNYLMTALMCAATAAVLVPLGLVFYHILKMGASSLSLDFFTQIPKPTGETGGGWATAWPVPSS